MRLCLPWLLFLGLGCDDPIPAGLPIVDADIEDARSRDRFVQDAAPAFDATPRVDARLDAVLPDAAEPDAMQVCTDRDEDGVTDCAGDCADDDPRVHPGAVEPCGGRDADCDGVVDERCVQPGDAVQWLPVERAAAQTVGERSDGGVATLGLALPALDDFRLLIDVDFVRTTPDALARILLKFEDGAHAILPMRPGKPLVLRYRGRDVSLDGTARAGGPIQLIIERVGGRLRAGVTTGTPGRLDVPAAILPTRRRPAPLMQVNTTCDGCQLRIDRLDVGRPFIAPPSPWHACANRVRNAAFTHLTDAVPDHWRVVVDDTQTDADRWRAQLGAVQVDAGGLRLPGGAPRVALTQDIDIPGDAPCVNTQVDLDGDGRLFAQLKSTGVCPCRPAAGPVDLPAQVRFERCAPGPAELSLHPVGAVTLRHVDLRPTAAAGPPCVAWPDRPPSRLPVPWYPPFVDPGDGIARVPLRRPDGRWAGADIVVTIDKTVDVSFPALGGFIDIIWQTRRGAPALVNARLPAQFPATIELPLPLAHVVRMGGLQVVHVPHSGEIASIAPTVTPTVDNPLAYAPVRLPPGEGALPPLLPSGRITARPRQLASTTTDLALLRALGVGGISVPDPAVAALPALLATAARDGLAVDLRLTRYESIWAQDGLDPYADLAEAVAGALCADCGPVMLTALDEPLGDPLRRCANEVAISPPEALAPAITACENCEPARACRQAFPHLIADLIGLLRDRLPAAVEVGIQLGGLGLLAELPAAVVSFRADWLQPDRAWSQSALEQMTAVGGRLATNVPVGTRPGQRAPSAVAHQALVLQMAALGAHPIRLEGWPPHSAALLDAIVDTEQVLTDLWPDFPARLRARLDTDHARAWAALYSDDLLLVINRTARTQSIHIDASPLGERASGHWLPVLGADATLIWLPDDALLRVGLAPHSAVLARLQPDGLR